MAKGLELKNTRVEELIALIHKEHPLWKAPTVHREVLRRIHDEKDDYYEPYIDDPKWPRKNTVYQHLRKIIGRDKARSPKSKELDGPWRALTLAKHGIPPEAVPKVLEIFIDKLKSTKMPVHLTIREAKWIGRLSFVLEDTKQLYMFAIEYAKAEQVAELLGGDVTELTDDTGLYEKMKGEVLSRDERDRVALN